ncbi:hypothetical protein F0U61_17805 [Archangium violaceum]|uniref:hypothetical protein n=1 Tax=Archangium violaceum TaxID=83451 RepID=UPI002B2FEF89|nr:hypothetical protein F0U61_17805 [Archangium violaceum]
MSDAPEKKPPYGWAPRALLGLAAVYLVFLAWFALRLQVRATVEAVGGAEPTLSLSVGEGRVPVPLQRASGVGENRLVLTHLPPASGASAEVRLWVGPTVHGGVIPHTDVRGDGDFAWSDQVGAFVSRQPGSRLQWQGVTSGLQLRVQGTGTLKVEWNGTEQLVPLDPAAATPALLTLPASRRLFLAQLPLWTRQLSFQGEQWGSPLHVALVFGNEVLLEREAAPDQGALTVKLSAGEQLSALGQFVGHTVWLYASCALLLLVYFLCGLATCARLLPRLAPHERWVVTPGVGFSLLALLTTSLSYLAPLRVGLPIAAGVILLALWAQRAWLLPALRALRESVTADRSDNAFLLATGLLSSAILFFPALVEGDWYLGHAYTDVFYYTNFAEKFLWTPMLKVAPHEEMSRYSEIVSLAVSAVLLRSDARSVYAVQGVVFWLLLPGMSWVLLRRMVAPVSSSGLTAARVGVVLTSFSAGIFFLFSQCYLAHYIFAFSLFWGVLLTMACLSDSASLAKAERWSLWIVTGIVYAFNVSIYPFQFLLPVAWAVVAVMARSAEVRRERIRELVFVGLVALVFLNVNASVILMFPAVRRFYGNFEMLNNIGKYIVFPFYKSPDFLVIAYGLRDFVLYSNTLSVWAREILGVDEGWTARLESIKQAYWTSGYVLTPFAGLLSGAGILACVRRSRKDLLFLLVTFVGFGAYLAYLAVKGETYAYGKLVMTLSAVVLLPLGLGITLAWESRFWRFTRPALFAFAVGFLVLNLASSSVESADSFVNRKSEELHKMRTHLPAIDIELKQLVRFMESEHERLGQPIGLSMQCRFQDFIQTDRDKVLMSRIDHLGWVLGGSAKQQGVPLYIVAFNEVGCGFSEPPALKNPLFRVLAPKQSEPSSAAR